MAVCKLADKRVNKLGPIKPLNMLQNFIGGIANLADQWGWTNRLLQTY